jgi:hypothetical protein
MANSAAILSLPESLFDVVRPGIMLYGASPFNGNHFTLKPAMQLSAPIVSITESAKTTADNLKNPLGGFDEYSKLVLVPFSLISSSPPLPVICAVLSASILS